jgi:hypothetical protein
LSLTSKIVIFNFSFGKAKKFNETERNEPNLASRYSDQHLRFLFWMSVVAISDQRTANHNAVIFPPQFFETNAETTT